MLMNLIQPALQVGGSFAKPAAPAISGQGQNAFAQALQTQPSGAATVIAKPDTNPASGSLEENLNATDKPPGWNGRDFEQTFRPSNGGWTRNAPAEIEGIPSGAPVDPVVTDLAKPAPPSLLTNEEAVLPAAKEAVRIPATVKSCPFSQKARTLGNSADRAGNPMPAAARVRGKPSTTKLATRSDPAAWRITVPRGPSGSDALEAISVAAAPIKPAVPEAMSPAPVSPAPERTIDGNKVIPSNSDQEPDSIPPLPEIAFSPQPLSAPVISFQGLQSASATSDRFGVQSFDTAVPHTSPGAPLSDGAELSPDELPLTPKATPVLPDSGQRTRQTSAAPLLSAAEVALTGESGKLTENVPPRSQVEETPSSPHEPVSIGNAFHATSSATHSAPTRMNAAESSGIARTQGNEAASQSPTNPHLSSPVPPATITVSPFHDMLPPTFSSVPPETHTAAPKTSVNSVNTDKGSGEPRSPSGQDTSATDNSVSAKPILASNPVAAPLTVDNMHAQARTGDEPSLTAINLTAMSGKAQASPGSEASAARAAVPPRGDQPGQPEPVNTGILTARMVEGIDQSDMRIGLRTQVFGTVNVHTALRDAQVGLAVSSERGDLRSFLGSEMPALQSALRQHDLHFENIKFVQPGNSASAFSANTNSGSHSFGQRQASMPRFSQEDATEEDRPPEDISLEIPARLNVHA